MLFCPNVAEHALPRRQPCRLRDWYEICASSGTLVFHLLSSLFSSPFSALRTYELQSPRPKAARARVPRNFAVRFFLDSWQHYIALKGLYNTRDWLPKMGWSGRLKQRGHTLLLPLLLFSRLLNIIHEYIPRPHVLLSSRYSSHRDLLDWAF